jgi:Na+-transporting NADH:ubiquinone oxidoreductase subunit C
MSNEKKPFRESFFYPIVFMLMITFIFVGVLAAMYRGSEKRIEDQNREAYERTILGICADKIASSTGEKAAGIIAAYPDSYEKYITTASLEGVDRPSFMAKVNGVPVAMVVDIPGKGLWGSMRALVALSPDLTTVLDLSIYEQMETPGLGARIGEEWFLKQFSGKQVIVDGKPIPFEQIPEKQVPENPSQIKKVTGASITTGAVLDMLTSELARIYTANQGARK